MRIKKFKQFEAIDGRDINYAEVRNKQNITKQWFDEHPLEVMAYGKPLEPTNMQYYENDECKSFSIDFSDRNYISVKKTGYKVDTTISLPLSMENTDEFVSWVHKAMIKSSVPSDMVENCLRAVEKHIDDVNRRSGALKFESLTDDYHETQVVTAAEDIEEVPSGTKGTIVHVYEGKSTFEVEFVVNGENIVKTVSIKQIQ